MEKDFLRVKFDVNNEPIEGYLDVAEILYFRRHKTEPNLTIVFFAHLNRSINICMPFADFCKALEELK